MSRELALLLAQGNYVKRWQLENALQAQLIYKIPLVMSLVKLGYVSEDLLFSFCSDYYGVSILNPDRWKNIPFETIKLIPKDFVYEWRVFPIEKKSDILTLAISRMPEKGLLDDIRLFLGFDVEVELCPESMMVEACRYYYAMILPALTKSDRTHAKEFKPPEDDFVEPELSLEEDEESDELSLDMDDGDDFDDLQVDINNETGDTVTGLEEKIREIERSISALEESGGSTDDLASESETEERSDGTIIGMGDDEMRLAEQEVALVAEQQESDFGGAVYLAIDEFQDELADAEDRDELISVVTNWLLKYYKIGCFLAVKKSIANGFFVNGSDKEGFKDFEISLNLDSAAKRAKENLEVIKVESEEDTSIEPLNQFFGIDSSEGAIIVPASLKGRCIGLFAGLDKTTDVPASDQWELFKQSLSSAFETIILSRKIGV